MDTTASSDNQTRLAAFMFLTSIFLVVEIVVGYITNSMALIADSFHMLSDVLALVIAFACVRMSPKKWSKNTFGWARAEILGALVNAVFLCALCFSILIESVKRFIKPDLIHDPVLILIVGGLGLFINGIGLFLFKDGGHPHHHHHHGHGHGHDHGHHHYHHHAPHKNDFKIFQGDTAGESSEIQQKNKKYGLLCKHKSHSGSQDFFCHDQDHEHDDHSPSPDEHNDCDGGHLTSKAHQHSDKTPLPATSTIHLQTSNNKLSKTSETNSTSDIHRTFRQANKQDYGSSTIKSTSNNHRHVDVGCHGHDHSHDDSRANKSQPTSSQMNMRGVFLHVMADALGSVIVMISALIVLYTDWSIRYYIDPILSVLMVMLMLKSTWPLLTESAMILLQTVPASIEVDSLRKRLTQEIQGVLAVHEFHVWQLAGNRIIASAHIRCHNLQDYMRIAEEVKEFFHNEGIHSTTIQPEFVDLENGVFDETSDADNCALNCPPTLRNDCGPQTCCGTGQKSNEITSLNEESSLTRRTKLSDQNRSGSSEVLDVSRLGQIQSHSNGKTETDTV